MQRRWQVRRQVERQRSQHYSMPGVQVAPTRESVWGQIQDNGPPRAGECERGTTETRASPVDPQPRGRLDERRRLTPRSISKFADGTSWLLRPELITAGLPVSNQVDAKLVDLRQEAKRHLALGSLTLHKFDPDFPH